MFSVISCKLAEASKINEHHSMGSRKVLYKNFNFAELLFFFFSFLPFFYLLSGMVKSQVAFLNYEVTMWIHLG